MNNFVIKVFPASSAELSYERDILNDVVGIINQVVKKNGVFVELHPWEFHDSSMGLTMKQEEYTEELKNCDIAIVLFWRILGEYTYNHELKVAIERGRHGQKPYETYVLFKEDNPEEVTDQLRHYKQSFSDVLANSKNVHGASFTSGHSSNELKLLILLIFNNYLTKSGIHLLKEFRIVDTVIRGEFGRFLRVKYTNILNIDDQHISDKYKQQIIELVSSQDY